MTKPIPEEVRLSASDALQELAARAMRAGATCYKKSADIMSDDPKKHARVIADLRRFQGWKMPGHDAIAVIEGALCGLTEADSKAAAERRRREKYRQQAREDELWRERRIKDCQPGTWHFNRTLGDLKQMIERCDLAIRVMQLANNGMFDDKESMDLLAFAIWGAQGHLHDSLDPLMEGVSRVASRAVKDNGDDEDDGPYRPPPPPRSKPPLPTGLQVIDGGAS